MSPVKQNPEVNFRNFDEQLILLDPPNAQLHQLNPVGARIWSLCDGSHTTQKIAEIIALEYEVTLEQAMADVDLFVSQLKEKKLLLDSNERA